MNFTSRNPCLPRPYKHSEPTSPSFLNRKGQGLLQALIGIALTGIVSLATISLLQNQFKEVAALTERLAKSEASAQLISALTDSTLCTYMMSNFSNRTFNGKDVAINQPKILITKILAGTSANAPSIVATNKAVSAMTTKVVPEEIYAQVRGESGDKYHGILAVKFKADKLTRSMKDIEIPLNFTVNPSSPLNQRQIDGCSIGTLVGEEEGENTAKAYFSWNGKKSTGTNVTVEGQSGRLNVTFIKPMSNNRYSVICSGAFANRPGTEMQIFTFNKTVSSFQVAGSHGGGADPIELVDCVVFGI